LSRRRPQHRLDAENLPRSAVPENAVPTSAASPGRPPRPEPFTLVIFGATGDLTHRKLVPAVYRLFAQGLLPDDFRVIGFARRDKSDDDWRGELRDAMARLAGQEVRDDDWNTFARNVFYHRSTFEDPDGYAALRERLCPNGGPCNALFYLAVQPNSFETVVNQLRDSGLARPGAADESPWVRVVVEKPFGHDLASSHELNELLGSAFDEQQVYRIDHYLGKETVQNLLVLRFANSIFEPVWNQKYVDHVQITVAESIGIEGRGAFYEQAGALRDIVQNHMMHLLSLVAMEAPNTLDPLAVRDEKVKLLRALRPIPAACAANDVVRAQYAAGTVEGERVIGYRDEEGVRADSTTETFVAFKTFIDNWRWSGVPFYLRTGKRMHMRVTELSVHFKDVPRVLFNAEPFGPLERNILGIRIQPNEGISMRFQVKVPGPAMRLHPHQMDFGYVDSFGGGPPDAYERLLLDAALGDATLFTRSDEAEAAWAFVAPVIEGCLDEPLPTYPAGSWGPTEADELIEADGRNWTILRRPRPKKPERK
jgi:glucose-6-phosphate 1-dehydrogenase